MPTFLTESQGRREDGQCSFSRLGKRDHEAKSGYSKPRDAVVLTPLEDLVIFLCELKLWLEK